MADMNKAIELIPDDSMAYFGRGLVKQKKGDSDGAKADFRKALEIKPDFVSAKRRLMN